MAPLLIDKDGVSIYVRSREHLPPHIHAFSGDDVALVNIRTGEIVEGYISGKKLKIVQEWLSENRAIVEENFYELNPRLRLPEKKEPTKKVPVKKKTTKKGGKKNGK
ncbi:MAG: hypothetical protein JWP12_1295 [Bacteroidetes bacterium]|nr:hypothetical protein [Bacteroidota bacterium]